VEPIIFAIIAFVISAIFKRKNASDDGGQTKPFLPQSPNQQSMKKLEDYAKEIYGDVQKQISERQTRTATKPEVIQQMKQVKETVLPVKEKAKTAPTSAARPGRLSLHQSNEGIRTTTSDSISLVPSSEKELLQAIVFSEILAAPKSKR
jgi:flagellar motor protein MotB